MPCLAAGESELDRNGGVIVARSSLSKDHPSLSQSLETQNPSFDLGHLQLGWGQAGFEEFREATVEIGGAQPRGHRIRVLLVGVAVFALEAPAP